ncbi:hypothetical protein F4677DRAFT_448912 [Hypoxylon crocopeplum]|nr:hypothetical protein F4677DRAFT_448912 [Hypoxylon crocopeplum]
METSSRRKACDTCFKKKIKCDMLKPACSNCLLYKVPCSTTVIRRRAAPPPAKEAIPTSAAVDGGGLEARLARIEAKLDRLGAPRTAVATAQLLSRASSQAGESAVSSIDAPLCSPRPNTVTISEDFNISSLTELWSVIDDYFRDFNSALPLFHQHSFMQMAHEYFSEPEQSKRSRAAWAAINVVLALGYRIRSVDTDNIIRRFGDGTVKKCIDNAQNELDELVTREEDTLGIQVLLGLVVLFQTNMDQKPASVLISTAVRLAHRLQLHVKSSSSKYPPDIARHRCNIFWLCYSLDKDISLRARIPSIQNDEDVDLDLPGTEPGDDGSYLQSIDGCSQLDYLRTRVQLAYVEGKVYDYLLSNRSAKLSLEARQERAAYLSKLLDQWLQSIPSSLQLESITTTLGKAPLTHMIVLYHTYLMCSTMVNGLYSLEAPWMKFIGSFSAADFHDMDHRAHAYMMSQPAVSSNTWTACVGVSRGSLKILNNESYSGCNLWLTGCAYVSAYIVLLANMLYFPSHHLVDYDRQLTSSTMGKMKQLLEHTGSETFMKLHVILISLEKSAGYAVDRAKRFAETYGPTPPVTTHPQYASYPSAQFEGLPDDFLRNLVRQPEDPAAESTWQHAPNLDASGVDLAGFDFSNEISTPAFMRDFSY